MKEIHKLASRPVLLRRLIPLQFERLQEQIGHRPGRAWRSREERRKTKRMALKLAREEMRKILSNERLRQAQLKVRIG